MCPASLGLIHKQENSIILTVFLWYVGIDLFSRPVARQVFSALQSLTSVFGMGTGGPSALITLTLYAFVLTMRIENRTKSFDCFVKMKLKYFSLNSEMIVIFP